jgi:cytidylate kinase/pantoate ligase/cytidylate kinase
MVITIDGPAGAGKSSVARGLAERLGFVYLNTGAMYRAVTVAALRQDVSWDDRDALADVAERAKLDLNGDHILLDGKDVSDLIRSNQVTTHVKYVADNERVRARLVEVQRQIARARNIVTEGRDQGTVAFPNAECKIFLTASPAERARRRAKEMQSRGEPIGLEKLLEQQNRRDQEDASRPVGWLRRADEAIEVDTDGLSLAEVITEVERVVRKKIPSL